MANINAQLPPAATIPFHPATESLQRENVNKPIIPKTEVTSAYQKMREDQERNQFSTQSRVVLQDQSKKNTDQSSQQDSSPQHKRSLFFARKGALSNADKGNKTLLNIKDFAVVISVIQARYRSAVSPLPDPTVDDMV